MIDPPTVDELFSRPLFKLGGTPMTLSGLAVGLGIIVVSYLVARLVVRLIARLRGRFNGSGAALYILEKFAGYGIFVIGLLFALSSIGLNLTSIGRSRARRGASIFPLRSPMGPTRPRSVMSCWPRSACSQHHGPPRRCGPPGAGPAARACHRCRDSSRATHAERCRGRSGAA